MLTGKQVTDQEMPKGPKGQKRAADVIGNAIRVAKIATGEEVEDFGADDDKDKAAQSMGRRGKAESAAVLRRARDEGGVRGAARAPSRSPRWRRPRSRAS